MNTPLGKYVTAYVISARREANVPAMEAATNGLLPTWVVPQAEATAYRRAGARRVLPVLGGLSAARNAALDHAAANDRYCLQLDDDLRKVARAVDGKAQPITLPEAVAMICQAMSDTGALLGGVAPTSNPYFSRQKVNTRAFIIGSLFVAAPCPIRFDPALRLKEDWDYTCQHLDTYGKVARCDDVLTTFTHYTNAGGVQRYRTDDLEQRITDVLLARWPGYLRPHGRRAHELAMRRGGPGPTEGAIQGQPRPVPNYGA